MSKPTARYISCAAKAMIGDAELYGSLILNDKHVVFTGGRIKTVRTLKNPTKTLIKRIKDNKKLLITAVSEHFTESWDNSACDLTHYSLSLSTSGHFNISFTLKERDGWK